jgi:hypothetical protein
LDGAQDEFLVLMPKAVIRIVRCFAGAKAGEEMTKVHFGKLSVNSPQAATAKEESTSPSTGSG